MIVLLEFVVLCTLESDLSGRVNDATVRLDMAIMRLGALNFEQNTLICRVLDAQRDRHGLLPFEFRDCFPGIERKTEKEKDQLHQLSMASTEAYESQFLFNNNFIANPTHGNAVESRRKLLNVVDGSVGR